MNRSAKKWKLAIFLGVLLTYAVGSLALTYLNDPSQYDPPGGTTPRPTNSSTIALSANDRWLWVVNEDVNAVAVFDLYDETAPQLFQQIAVGTEPRAIALTNNFAFVTNMVDGTVSVISTSSY